MARAVKNQIKKECAECHRSLTLDNYYNTKNILCGSDGKAQICKSCIKKMIDYDNMQTIYNVLQGLDLPFFYDSWANCIEKNPDNPWGVYIRMANSGINEFKDSSWKDSIFKPQLKSEEINTELNKKISQAQDFVVTDEIEDKWGAGYELREYQAFEKKYNALKNNYQQKTAMHTEALLKYIRYSVKEEFATAKGEVGEAGKWGDLASKAATAAKINPSQLTKADLTDGLSTFSELSQAVEKEVDIIPILPRFKYRPNDALDFNIWCYINYARDLSGLPLCEYEDVYAFYDKRKADYIAQYGDPYGIFTNDTSEKNREKIKNFIKEDENDNI